MRRLLTIQIMLLISHLNFGQTNYSGLYTSGFDGLDLKSNDSLTYNSSSPCGPPFYFTEGIWKKKNDSTLTLTFFKDSSTLDYKILSETEIVSLDNYRFDTLIDKKGIVHYYDDYFSFIKVKGYYADGKTEWEVDYKWKNGYARQSLNGKCTYHFPTGQIKSTGLIKDGKREGKWIIFDLSGKKSKKEFYKNNKLTKIKNNG